MAERVQDWGEALAYHPEVRRLLAHMAEIERLRPLVAAALPPDLRPHLTVLNVRDGVLILGAESPAWVARARWAAPDLLATLTARAARVARADGKAEAARPSQGDAALPEIDRIEVRISLPAPALPELPVDGPTPLSAGTVRLLRECAETVADPALATRLRRLARRGEAAAGEAAAGEAEE
jgi:hypothetical protein